MILAAQDRAADEGRLARIFAEMSFGRASHVCISAASPPVFLAHGLEVGGPVTSRCLVVLPVTCEPVSVFDFPLTREIMGNFAHLSGLEAFLL
jgi:hypothetical protein